MARAGREAAWVVAALLCPTLVLCRNAKAQDTVTVHADQPPVWGAAPRLVEEMRIGALEGPEQETFGRLVAAAVGPSGEVVVADELGPSLRLFGSDGRYLRDLGRAGQGPGEYLQLAGVRFTREGHVAVWDPGNERITIFAEDGSVVRVIRVNSTLRGGADPFQVDTAGNFYVRAVRSQNGGVISQYTWIRLGPEGSVLDSLPIPRAAPNGRPLTVLTRNGPLEPFTVETVAALGPHGDQVVGRTDDYTLWWPHGNGRVMRIERTSRVVPMGREERQQWRAVLDWMQSMSGTDAQPFMPIPSKKPVFRGLWVDEEGRVWVHRYVEAVHVPMSEEERETRRATPPLEWVEPPVWDVVDDRGVFQGSLQLPMGAFPVAARGRKVWVIARGPMDESYFVRYGIVPGG